MADDAALQPEVAALFLALADLLSAAPEAAWDTRSLCESWHVHAKWFPT